MGAKGKVKRVTFYRVSAAIALLIFLLSASSVMYLVSQYYKYLDAYSGDVAREDQIAAREDMEKLQYFYELNGRLKPYWLDGVAEEYIFKGTLYHEAAYDYLVSRYERVLERLQNDQGFWARFLRANAKWRLAQGIFEQSLQMSLKTKLEMQMQADELASSTRDDYEEAVKATGGGHLPSSWNYDLTTNDGARAGALQPKVPGVKIRLGEGGKKDKGLGKDKGRGPKGEGSQDLEIEGPPTEGKPKSGAKRPG